MRQRWLWLVIACMVFATACGGDGESPSGGERSDTGSSSEASETSGAAGGSEAGGEVELALFGGPEEVAGYEDMVAAFEEENPDVDVTVAPVPEQDDLAARLTTGFAAGDPPDVFLINYRNYGQYADQGVLEPVQGFLDESDAISEDEFAETSMEAFRFDGENLTCMPQNVSSLVVY